MRALPARLKRSFERRGYEVVLPACIEDVRNMLGERTFGNVASLFSGRGRFVDLGQG